MRVAQTVAASWLYGVLDALDRCGVDRRKLTAFVQPFEQSASTRYVQHAMVRRLWRRAVALNPDPLLGVKVGAMLPLSAINVLALLMIQSGSLRQALDATVAYQGLTSNSGRFALTTSSRRAGLRYTINPGPVPMPPAQIDSVFSGYLSLLYHCAPLQRPRRIDLIGADKATREQYEAHFECPVRLGVASPAISFDMADLETPWPGRDSTLFRVIEQQAKTALLAQRRSESLVEDVRAQIVLDGFDRASAEQIADRLGYSLRTLQRRLADEGSSFRALVFGARMDEALKLLAEGMLPVGVIAQRLGYTEAGAFSYAVRSYFGAAPRQLQRQLASPP